MSEKQKVQEKNTIFDTKFTGKKRSFPEIGILTKIEDFSHTFKLPSEMTSIKFRKKLPKFCFSRLQESCILAKTPNQWNARNWAFLYRIPVKINKQIFFQYLRYFFYRINVFTTTVFLRAKNSRFQYFFYQFSKETIFYLLSERLK